MWSDNVDNWLKNEINNGKLMGGTKGEDLNLSNTYIFLVVATGIYIYFTQDTPINTENNKYFFFFVLIAILIVLLKLIFRLISKLIFKLIKPRKVEPTKKDTDNRFYHTNIYSRSRTNNISDIVCKRIISRILDEQATEIEDTEEIVYVISSGYKSCGIVITTKRLLYYLNNPKKIYSESYGFLSTNMIFRWDPKNTTSGTFLITDLLPPKLYPANESSDEIDNVLSDYTWVQFGDTKIGTLKNFEKIKYLENLLRQIHREIQRTT